MAKLAWKGFVLSMNKKRHDGWCERRWKMKHLSMHNGYHSLLFYQMNQLTFTKGRNFMLLSLLSNKSLESPEPVFSLSFSFYWFDCMNIHQIFYITGSGGIRNLQGTDNIRSSEDPIEIKVIDIKKLFLNHIGIIRMLDYTWDVNRVQFYAFREVNV